MSTPVLHCWARRAIGGAVCQRRLDLHGSDHGALDGDQKWLFWSDRDCAPEAGSNGRETAALRILEMSHELDRLAFPGEALFAADVRRLAEALHANETVAEHLTDFEEVFQPAEGEPDGFGGCLTDGHYICVECVHIALAALRRKRGLCGRCGEPLTFRNITDHDGTCIACDGGDW